jgi:hypothetical protein
VQLVYASPSEGIAQKSKVGLSKCLFTLDDMSGACTSRSDTNTACGPKLTDVDRELLKLPIWNGRNVPWSTVEARYQMGPELGKGSYARVNAVPFPGFDVLLKDLRLLKRVPTRY